MRKAIMFGALLGSLLLSAVAPAQERRPGFRHRPGFGRPYYPYYPYGYPYRSGFGFGLGFGFSRPAPRPTVYRNAFTADVGYTEQAMNAFRAAYEKRKGDPLGIKKEIQRLDEDLERMRRDAETYGSATIRGTDLLRDALANAERVDDRFRTADEQAERWNQVRDLLERLRETYGLKPR